MRRTRLIAGVSVLFFACTALTSCSHTEPRTVQAQSNAIWIPVPSDMLAISFGYSEAVDGAVRPGSRVDVVLVTLGARGLPSTTTVLRKIEVAGVVPGTPKALPTVTLLTSPKDAERLAQAFPKGYIHLRLPD